MEELAKIRIIPAVTDVCTVRYEIDTTQHHFVARKPSFCYFWFSPSMHLHAVFAQRKYQSLLRNDTWGMPYIVGAHGHSGGAQVCTWWGKTYIAGTRRGEGGRVCIGGKEHLRGLHPLNIGIQGRYIPLNFY